MKRKMVLQEAFHVWIVLFSATVYSLGVMWFLSPAGLYAAGVTGIGQILSQIINMITSIEIPLGVFTFALNVPLFVYGWKRVSIRFAIYSLLSVIVQSILMMDWIPVYTFGINALENQLLFALIGGLVTGVANGIALRYGTSTGGIDIVAQALSISKGVSIGTFSMVLNCSIALIGGGFISHAWEISMYTFIRIIISSIVVDKIHTAYNYVRIDIISKYPDEVAKALLEGIKRGCTILDVKGAYTNETKSDVFMIISSYEMQKAAEIVRLTDPGAFMTVSPIKRIFGKFFKHTII